MGDDAQQAEATEQCVLFSDISGSTRLYETIGDRQASQLVLRCLDEMKAATQQFHGRVVQIIGDEILAVFPTPDHALYAAMEMMRRVDLIRPAVGKHMALRSGMHHGKMVEENGNVFGDTVNTAARIVALAKAGQLLASRETVQRLSPMLRRSTREIADFQLKGKAEAIGVCEILWKEEESSGDMTVQFRGPAPIKPPTRRLVLALGQRRYVLPDASVSELNLGREADNEIVIDDLRASRRHAKIERRLEKFVLVDKSTNGTWVLFEGMNEVLLKHEEIVLHGRGIITLGHAHAPGDSQEKLEFSVE
jgi:class 3 adenylate cyclase